VYEDEVFIGKVAKKDTASNCALVRCLTLPYGIKVPQGMETEKNSAWYKQIYATDIEPYQVAEGPDGKTKRGKWFWKY